MILYEWPGRIVAKLAAKGPTNTMSIPTVLLFVAMVATLVVLLVGLVGFFIGGEFNARYGNKLMRARVALQAVAVVLLLVVLASAS